MLSLGISRSNWRDTVVLFINKNCFLNSQKENTNHASHNEWQVKSPRVCTLCQDYHRPPLCTSLSQQLSGCDIFIIYSGSSSKFWVSEEIVLNRRSKEEGLSRRQQALYPGIISFLPKNFLCCAVNIHTYTQPYPGSKVLNTKCFHLPLPNWSTSYIQLNRVSVTLRLCFPWGGTPFYRRSIVLIIWDCTNASHGQ